MLCCFFCFKRNVISINIICVTNHWTVVRTSSTQQSAAGLLCSLSVCLSFNADCSGYRISVAFCGRQTINSGQTLDTEHFAVCLASNVTNASWSLWPWWSSYQKHICITSKAMHHQPGVCSQHRRTGSSVPSAVPNVTLIRESCRPAGRKRLFFVHIFGAVCPQILTQQRQIWSPLGNPSSPSFWQ